MNQKKQQLPNSTATLVLGILSIVLGCGILGLVFGIIGLVLSKEGKLLYDENPNGYSGWGNLNAGRIMCIIGIVFSGLSIIYIVSILAIGGSIIGILAKLGAFY